MSGLRGIASQLLSADSKRRLKTLAHRMRMAYVTRMRAYGYQELVHALRLLGIREGDAVLMHGRVVPQNGFRDSPPRVIAAMLESVGGSGTLLVPSVPYESSTAEYLESAPTFHVGRTPSRMGILSEVLRRHRAARRSTHPAHPVVAVGPDAEWFVSGHEQCEFSCGPGTPWEKLIERDAKVLFFDVGLSYMTFYHHLEHVVSTHLSFPLYASDATKMRVVSIDGNESFVWVRPFSIEARRRRRIDILERELRRSGHVRETRVGNTRLLLVRTRDAFRTTLDMAQRNEFFYDLDA